MKLKMILFIIITLTISSCYTVLKHPEVPNEDRMGNVYHQNISSNDNCYQCHTEDNREVQDYNRYSNFYSENENEAENHERTRINKWDSYYSVPWWFSPPKISVNTGAGGSVGIGGPINNSNQTTSNSEGSRTTGSTRTEVNLNLSPSVNSNANSSSNTNNENSTSTENNQSSGRSNNNNTEDKRNTGSTRER